MEKNKISEKKLFTILAIDLFSMTGVVLPSIIVRSGNQNGLSGLLIASAFALLAACYFLWATKYGEYGYDMAVEKLPSYQRYLIGLIYCIRYFLHGLFLMVVFVALIQEVLLPNQNTAWILIPFLLVVYLSAGKSISVRGSILEVLFPFIFLPLLVVLILALFEVDYGSLSQQILNYDKNNSLSSFYTIFLFYQPIEFLLFLAPCRKPEKKKSGQAVIWACIFVIAINILIYIVTLGMFGAERTEEKLWSALYIMQSVRLPGHFVERLDILFLVFYIFSTFALVSGYLFYSETMIAKKENDRKKKIYSISYLIGIFLLVLANRDVEKFYDFFLSYKKWIDLPLALLLPLWIRLRGDTKKRVGTKAAALMLCMAILGSVTGCQHKVDIEDRNYVMALGIEPGEENKYRIVYETADLSKSNSEGGGMQQGKSISFSGSSLQDVEQQERKSDDKRMDYGHLKAILFQQSLVENEKLWNQIIKELEGKKNLAGTILVFFTKESPEEYMKLVQEGGTSLGAYLERMMANHKGEGMEEYTLSRLLRAEAENESFHDVPVLEMEDEILRFHIRANSDSEEDQVLKTKVKDRILPYLQNLFADCDTKEECMEIAVQAAEQIEKETKKACVQEGADYEVSAYVCRESFPLKQYGSAILPSGRYDALRIDIGEAEGANWWCMMYPSLCMTEGVVEAANGESSFSEDENNTFHVKWRISEIFQKFFGEL